MSSTDPQYDSREQSEIKHFALRLYLEAAARILGSTRNLKYIDCCAGPWESKSSNYRDTSFGIAVRVLKDTSEELGRRGKSPELACLLIEKDSSKFTELETFSKAVDSSTVRVHARNWDFTERITDIVRYCTRPGTFPFIFIDPKGWKLAGISNIRPLLQLAPGEVLINLMLPFIGRFIKDGKTDFSDLLGEDFPELRKLSGPELEFEIVRKYSDLIKKEGNYAYVCSLPVMNPDLDTFNFHLIYATRHMKGVKVFKDVERRTEEMTHIVRAEVQQRDQQVKTGNYELFAPGVQYKENRYQQLSRENKDRAQSAVWALLKSADSVSYDDCWAEALQFSAVYEIDLRGWIAEWAATFKVAVTGMLPRSKVLQTGKNLTLSLITTNGSPTQ
jgi:three-Cys-motif partner protein